MVSIMVVNQHESLREYESKQLCHIKRNLNKFLKLFVRVHMMISILTLIQ